MSESFLNLAGEDGEIDPYELRDILNAVFTRGETNKTDSVVDLESYLLKVNWSATC